MGRAQVHQYFHTFGTPYPLYVPFSVCPPVHILDVIFRFCNQFYLARAAYNTRKPLLSRRIWTGRGSISWNNDMILSERSGGYCRICTTSCNTNNSWLIVIGNVTQSNNQVQSSILCTILRKLTDIFPISPSFNLNRSWVSFAKLSSSLQVHVKSNLNWYLHSIHYETTPPYPTHPTRQVHFGHF